MYFTPDQTTGSTQINILSAELSNPIQHSIHDRGNFYISIWRTIKSISVGSRFKYGNFKIIRFVQECPTKWYLFYLFLIEGDAVPGNGGETTWCFSQVKGTLEDDVTEADLISCVEFNHDGELLATGDKGGRVVIFQVRVYFLLVIWFHYSAYISLIEPVQFPVFRQINI